jgi:2',3'-cyclic-nucleotide 2'-phosphodiesterase (5'-nucleotidase family)
MWRVVLIAAALAAAPVQLAEADQTEPIRIVIVHTNDIHGGIDKSEATFMDPEFPPILGGGASLAGLVEKVRAEAEAEGKGFLLIDTGDIWQGTPVGNYREGEVVMAFMNKLGYDVWVPGNHEFDAGLESAFKIMNAAEFPVLAANLLDTRTGEVPPPAVPYIIKEVSGVRIGMIGLITEDTPHYALPEDVDQVAFLNVKEITEKYLKEIEDRVDLVFVLGHLGIPYDVDSAYREMMESGGEQRSSYGMNAMELAHHVPGIDLMACGHIHVGYERGWEDPLTHTICLQTYGRGSGVGIWELEIDPETKQIVGYEHPEARGSLLTLFEDEFWPDPELGEFISARVETAEVGMDEPIGTAVREISRVGPGESQLGNMVTDAMREATGADAAFTNLGGIRTNIRMGVITPRDVFKAIPFDNKLVVYEMSGSYLKYVLETRIAGGRHGLYVSGIRLVYNRTRPDFDRIVELEVAGRPWHPDSTYRVTTTDFIAEGNVGLQILTEVDPDYVDFTGIDFKEAVIEYIGNNSPLAPEIEGRFVRDDARGVAPDLARALPAWKSLDAISH